MDLKWSLQISYKILNTVSTRVINAVIATRWTDPPARPSLEPIAGRCLAADRRPLGLLLLRVVTGVSSTPRSSITGWQMAGPRISNYDPETKTLRVRGTGNKEREVYAAGGADFILARWLGLRGTGDPGDPLFLGCRRRLGARRLAKYCNERGAHEVCKMVRLRVFARRGASLPGGFVVSRHYLYGVPKLQHPPSSFVPCLLTVRA